eukprot:m.110701 g.110701  ORF g.110701 m.110701 type:complete len:336 (+) comp14049_c0_seq1:318-1325(+)
MLQMRTGVWTKFYQMRTPSCVHILTPHKTLQPPKCNKRRFSTIVAIQQGLECIQSTSGMSWGCVIVSTTAAARIILTGPPSIYQQKILARFELLGPTMFKWQNAVKHKTASECRRLNLSLEETNRILKEKWGDKFSEIMHKEFGRTLLPTKLLGSERAHKFSLVLRQQGVLLAQIPLWISMSLAIRGLVDASAATDEVMLALSTGGFLWFPNLLLCDNWYGLPLITAASNLFNVEFNSLMRSHHKGKSKGVPKIKTMLRGLSFAILYIGTQVPSAVCLFWSVSSMYSVMQNLLLNFASVRYALGIPRTPHDTANPITALPSLVRGAIRDFRKEIR